jgi:hypothetical protein
MESIIDRLDQAEQKMTGTEDKYEKTLHSDINKQQQNQHNHYL